jgi:hypothetical protein
MLTISFGARPQQDRDKASVGDHLYSSDRCDDLAPIAALIAYRLLQDGEKPPLYEVPSGHAHCFRDTFAVKMLLAGIPLERVSIGIKA